MQQDSFSIYLYCYPSKYFSVWVHAENQACIALTKQTVSKVGTMTILIAIAIQIKSKGLRHRQQKLTIRCSKTALAYIYIVIRVNIFPSECMRKIKPVLHWPNRQLTTIRLRITLLRHTVCLIYLKRWR